MFALLALCVLLACSAHGLVCGGTSLQDLDKPACSQMKHNFQLQINERSVPEVKGHDTRAMRGKGSKVRKLLLPLVLALQFKTLSLVPVLLVVTLLVGLKTSSAAILAAILSGASLLRDLLGNDRRGNGASSRVSYEVKQPTTAAAFNTPVVTPTFNAADPFYPPGMLYNPPEYKIFSAASNGRSST